MATKKKRTAEAQLTKDTPEDETGEKNAGSWKEASGTSISHRKILKVKRKDGELEPDPEPRSESDSTSKSLPSFDFGVESSESTPSFDFQWKGSSDGEKDVSESAKEGGEKEAASEGADSTGSSSWNFSWGSDGGGFGAFDASAFKSFGSVASSAGTESAFSTTGSESLEATASAFVEQPPPVAVSALAFKDGKAEKAGTEDDQTLLRVQSKVYVIREESAGSEAAEEETAKDSKKEQKFVESGHGDLHVNLFQEEGKTRARLVLRMEKTQRLVLNAPIFKDMDYKIQGEKFLRVVSFNLEGKPTLYLLKFKTKQEVQQVKSKIDAASKRIGEPYGSSAPQEPEQEAESEQTEEAS